MEIVIEIPENVYQFVMNTSFVEDERSIFTQSKEDRKKTMFLFDILDAIRNGKPLPKGHGNLKDVDAIHKEIEKLQNGISKQGGQVHISRDQYKGLCYARGIINEAQTIIEADGGGEDDS